MAPRERILALRLLEKQERDSEYINKIGVYININRKESPRNLEYGGKSNV